MKKLFAGLCLLTLSVSFAYSQRQMENLDRAVVAVRNPEGNVFVSWRLLATEPPDIVFNLYRSMGNGKAKKLNKAVISKVTHFVDTNNDNSVMLIIS